MEGVGAEGVEDAEEVTSYSASPKRTARSSSSTQRFKNAERPSTGETSFSPFLPIFVHWSPTPVHRPDL